MAAVIVATTPTHSSKAEEMLEGTGCVEIYEQFELCLANNDRSFTICQPDMMKFRKCMDEWGEKKHVQNKKRVKKGEKTTASW
jgi:hypothetical protein